MNAPGGKVVPETLKLQRCDICGTIAMPDPTVACARHGGFRQELDAEKRSDPMTLTPEQVQARLRECGEVSNG